MKPFPYNSISLIEVGENNMTNTKYYCTNCGSILDNQYGFDPDLPAWKCTSCGQVLYGDSIGSRFPGIVWFCDDCGAILSNQPGFSDEYDKWKCTECGYINEIEYCEHEDGEEYEIKEINHTCPHCGSVLDDQYGFDEDKEIWKCSNCDTVLFGPDYTEDEDDYDGTVYWCEECGEVLNVQDGFDEDYDTWCCTECGYENRLSEEEHLCPNCGATLNDQYGFDADKEIWKCSNCDSVLFGPDYTEDEDDYDGTVYRCEECGEVLNVQDDFDEDNDTWYCTECGHENSLLHEIPDEENAENDYVFTGYREYENIISNYDKLFSGEPFLEKEQHNRNDCYSDVPADEPVRKSLFQKIAAFGSKLFGNSTTRRKILLELSTYECIGKDYRHVANMLQDKGFFNIKCFPVYDLDYGFLYMENHISDIKIGGTQWFLSNTQFSANAPIIIKYHCAKMVSPPLNYRNAKGKPYKDVCEKYINAGFGNIEMEPVYDLVLGLLKRNHSIAKITINDIEKFSNKNVFRVDAVVKIQYHAFKKDRP